MTNKHGANLFELSQLYKFDINKIMDFSSNINPFGANKEALCYIKEHIEMVSIYPDPEYVELKNSISKYCGCNKNDVLLGSGATPLISGYIKYVSPKKSMILQPAYSEYEKELLSSGSEIFNYRLMKQDNFAIDIDNMIESINSNNIDLLIVCNPNNPTGTILSRNEIMSLLTKTDAKILIDETYIEFTDIHVYSSTILSINNPNIFVIRGTSKFFATPGIRLGYAITSDDNAKNYISKSSNLWDINIIASTLGEQMFVDEKYIQMTFEKITSEMQFLEEGLKKIQGLKVYHSKGNFILCEITNETLNSNIIYNLLIKKGIAIRNCSSFDGLSDKFFRVCVLNHFENQTLLLELTNIFTQKNE